MKTTASNLKIRRIISMLRDGDLKPRPYFQRRLVWSSKDKEKFIETILLGYPFPEIYLADGDVDLETGVGNQLVVDGQQRVTTIYDYFNGSLQISKKSPLIKPYSDLDDGEKQAFLGYDVAVRDLGSLSTERLIDVFRRINITTYSLNDMEVNNAIYSGLFKDFAEKLAQCEFFEMYRFFRPAQIKRMGDTRYCAVLAATMIHGYFNRDDELSYYLERYNEEFPQEKILTKRCNKVFDFLKKLSNDPKSRLWKQTDFFTVFIELDKFFEEGVSLDPLTVSRALTKFYNEVDAADEQERTEDASRYQKAVIQAANDRVNRVRRGDVIRQVLVS